MIYFGDRQSKKNLRNEKRDSCSIEVTYSYETDIDGKKHNGPWKNFTTDISYSGMGLYSKYPARENQEIKIFLPHVFSEPIKAKIKWCEKLRDDLYRIGVSYF